MRGPRSLGVVSEFCLSYHSRESGNYHEIEKIAFHFGNEMCSDYWVGLRDFMVLSAAALRMSRSYWPSCSMPLKQLVLTIRASLVLMSPIPWGVWSPTRLYDCLVLQSDGCIGLIMSISYEPHVRVSAE